MTVGPSALFLVVFAALYATRGAGAAWFLVGMAAGCFIGGGKLVIFAGAADGAPLGVWALAALVVYADAATALFMLANLHHLDRVRVLGRHLASAHETARGVLRANPWMRRLMWSGITGFVAIPFQGTGSVLGVLLGRILGLTHASIFSAIVVGTSASAVALALLGRFWRHRITWLVENPFVGLVVLGVALAVTLALGRWFTRRGAPRQQGNVV